MTNVEGPIASFAVLPSIEAYLSAHEGSQSSGAENERIRVGTGIERAASGHLAG